VYGAATEGCGGMVLQTGTSTGLSGQLHGLHLSESKVSQETATGANRHLFTLMQLANIYFHYPPVPPPV